MHFHARLFAHYGIRFAPGDFSQMIRDIQEGRAVKLQDLKGGRAIYSVRIWSAYERIFVIISDERYVVTALPPTKDLRKLRLLRPAELGLARIRVVARREEGG